ncbi:MAG TPA: metallophosphoesterase [Acidimicrobiales bacterium]|nr:metallophosphoesterase [Acidimicrobiales bacterium]
MTGPHPDRSVSRLWAISDLHVEIPANRNFVDRLEQQHHEDWLVVAGDVGEFMSDITWALGLLARRFTQVVWVPGNHELWTRPDDPNQLRGVERYEHLVEFCRSVGILTPEDAYATWNGSEGPVRVAPIFTLYDYSFLPQGSSGKEEALARAYAAGSVCTDEFLLHADPFDTTEQWCADRVARTRATLEEATKEPLPTVLVDHFPLRRELLARLLYPEFSIWCGTTETSDWHSRFPTPVVVYGHLHIPSTRYFDGVRYEEVSLGYPREWKRRRTPVATPRVVLENASA